MREIEPVNAEREEFEYREESLLKAVVGVFEKQLSNRRMTVTERPDFDIKEICFLAATSAIYVVGGF